ncbi:MAG: choloylglycine hydrolase family protein [Ruminococcaceae bacterium]|nr:choloylglycine hydrolase family protein [Oscillospiraceae bacterium]
MCTALSFDHFFGRNMDLAHPFNHSPIYIPKGFEYLNRACDKHETVKRSILGMGTMIDNHPAMAEAMNEHGLGCAGLNFTEYAYFEPNPVPNKTNIAPYDFILWVLSNFDTVYEVEEAIKDIELVNIPINKKTPIPTLHWMISDKSGHSIVVEKTRERLSSYKNPVGVMANDPTFDWHLTNLNEYIKLSPAPPKATIWSDHPLTALGIGAGTLGIPGDFSSVSRFVRTAFLRANLPKNHSLAQFFHILDNAAMVRGGVLTEDGAYDQTLYSSCMDLKNGIYYYKTYENNRINAVRFCNDEKIRVFPYLDEQDINFQN